MILNLLNWSSSIIFFIFGVVGWFIYKVYIWPYYISPLRNVPGPPSDSLFHGNIKRLFVGESGKTQLEWVKKYGSVVKYHRLLNKPSILIADTKIIQEITLSNAYDYHKFKSASNLAIGGEGLVFVEGEIHKRQRKMMSPVFSHNNVKEMVPTFIRVSSALKDLIDNEINIESEINLTPYISKATLDIIGLVGFNYEFNSLTSQNELADAYDSLLNSPATTSRIAMNLLSNYIPHIRKVPIEANKRFNNAREIIDRVSRKLIEEKYNEAKANNDKLNGNDLLSLLININKTLPVEEKMTDEELKYQIMTFLLAGHETTNVTICWALYLLSIHPHEQDSLREELVKAFPDKSKFNPTFDEINSLEYLNCIAKETLRLYTPVPNSNRVSVKDKVFGGHFIPKGTDIILSIGTLQRLPSIWGSTAEDFDPKRWLNPSLIENVSNLNYLPFFNGVRSCIGSKVALIEFKIILGMLVRNFVFKPVEGLHIGKRVFPVTKPDPYLGLMISRVES